MEARNPNPSPAEEGSHGPHSSPKPLYEGGLFAGVIDRALHHWGHVPALDGGFGVFDLDFDGSDIDTALPDDDDDVVSLKNFSQESV